MPAYHYRAVHASGQIAQGSAAAANEKELAHRLADAGLELIDARVKKELPLLGFLRRPPSRGLVVFTGQMLDLLEAGIPFADALRNTHAATAPGIMRDALGAIMRDIDHGSRIAAAFARHPRLFPASYTAILGAGDISGDQIATLRQLLHYAESRAKAGEQLRRALRYPLFLLCVTFGVISFMMVAVMPKIVGFLNTIDSELPLATRILVRISSLFAEEWWVAVLSCAAMAAILGILRRESQSAGVRIDRLILRLPVLGRLLKKLSLARFMRSFAILFQSGIGVPAGLRTAKTTLGNKALEAQIETAERQVTEGGALSFALKPVLSATALHLIHTGEHGGNLGKSLEDAAAYYDRGVTEDTEKIMGALEPALTILIGAMLAWIVLAVLGPIYGSISKLGSMGY